MAAPPGYGAPRRADQGRHDQHAKDELPDGAPARDPGGEDPHERGPGEPPSPVEAGELAEEIGVLVEGVDVEAHVQEVL